MVSIEYAICKFIMCTYFPYEVSKWIRFIFNVSHIFFGVGDLTPNFLPNSAMAILILLLWSHAPLLALLSHPHLGGGVCLSLRWWRVFQKGHSQILPKIERTMNLTLLFFLNWSLRTWCPTQKLSSSMALPLRSRSEPSENWQPMKFLEA